MLTGAHLKMTTPQDVVTARDSLEWYDDRQFAVARGNALGVRADRRIRADILTAEVVTPKGQGSHISRMDAHGHVLRRAHPIRPGAAIREFITSTPVS